MIYNKFCSTALRSFMKVIIEKPSCTGRGESILVFKHLNLLSSQSSLRKANEVLDSMVVAVVSDFKNHHR